MRNKTFIILGYIILPLLCSAQESVEQKMLGEWNLCKIYTGKVATSFNVCPVVWFKKSNKGFLRTKNVCEFEWRMSGDMISLKFKKKINPKDIMLGLSGCKVLYSNDEKLEKLELIDIKSDRKYVLRR